MTGIQLIATVCALAFSAPAFSQTASAEWANFRGPNHDGTIAAPKGVTWKGARLSKVWKKDTNSGFSSFAVAGAKAYTLVTGEVDGNSGEMLVCMDARTGKELWSKPLTVMGKYDGGGDAGTRDNKGGDGARSSPVVNGGKVYVIDSNLGVFCFDAATGKEVWKRDVMKENAGVQIKWHNAASPVIEGNVLMMCGGGSGQALLGLNKDTGEVIWKGEDDKMTHATPIIATLHGVKQCIFFTQKGLVAVTPADGKVLWRQDYKFAVSTAASPVVWEDIVYCSAGYGVGAGAYKISKNGSEFSSKEIWRKEGDDLANHWSTPVVKDGYLYGMFSFKKYGEGPLACVDIRTGEMKWSEAGFGPGQVILVSDTVVAISDKGEIVAAAATPEKYTELKRDDVLDGKVWSYPVLAYGHLFARSTTEGVCLQIK
jgi:outer membrane protein assembly factor BamB